MLASVLLVVSSFLGWAQSAEVLLLRGQDFEAAGNLEGALESYSEVVREHPDDWRAPMLRGHVFFRMGDNDRALSDFDRVVELAPRREPHLWQRGISQYYAGAFAACTAQFELHRTVNPNDVENAVWHFLCVTRDKGLDAARESVLPVGSDERAPMREVYRLFQGEIATEAVLAAADALDGGPARALARFYAELYIGLYLEATGDPKTARAYLGAAADSGEGGYMGDVARHHVAAFDARR